MIAAEHTVAAMDFRETDVWKHARFIAYASYRLGAKAPPGVSASHPLSTLQEYAVAIMTTLIDAFTEKIEKRYLLFKTAYQMTERLEIITADALSAKLISGNMHNTMMKEIQRLQVSLRSYS